MDYMGFTVEPWAKQWLEEQRSKGERCLEIKVSNGNHYVYRSTSRYDKETKKAKKVSEYLGSLDEKAGFIPKEKDARKRARIVTIRETGVIRLLDQCAGEMLGYLEAYFPHNYDQLYALAMIRCTGTVPLKRAASVWEKHENIRHIRPAMSPKSLSDMLESVGSDRLSQDRVFNRIGMASRELAMDLSEFFSSSDTVSYAEDGYNPDHEDLPQINVSLVVSLDSGIPMMIRCLPGSVRDMQTVCASVKEMNRDDVTLIMDRGFYSKTNIDVLDGSGLKFIFPVKRNSMLYERVTINEYDTFEYHGRLIRYGKCRYDHHWAYRFKDEEMKLGEERAAFAKYRAGEITKEKLQEKQGRMGQMIMVSNLDLEPEEVFLMFKRRDKVEKRFRDFKSNLSADVCYLRDDMSVAGHVFVSFLSLYILAQLEDRIRKANLLSKYSVYDILHEYSKAYAVRMDDGVVDYEVPNKLQDLDAKLEFDIFPILRS
jgi:hypothetical protein